jgi:hypothetical protein
MRERSARVPSSATQLLAELRGISGSIVRVVRPSGVTCVSDLEALPAACFAYLELAYNSTWTEIMHVGVMHGGVGTNHGPKGSSQSRTH